MQFLCPRNILFINSIRKNRNIEKYEYEKRAKLVSGKKLNTKYNSTKTTKIIL